MCKAKRVSGNQRRKQKSMVCSQSLCPQVLVRYGFRHYWVWIFGLHGLCVEHFQFDPIRCCRWRCYGRCTCWGGVRGMHKVMHLRQISRADNQTTMKIHIGSCVFILCFEKHFKRGVPKWNAGVLRKPAAATGHRGR